VGPYGAPIYDSPEIQYKLCMGKNCMQISKKLIFQIFPPLSFHPWISSEVFVIFI
jgi:hypothetical protein